VRYLSLFSFFKPFDVYFLLVCICVCVCACECNCRVACCNVGVVHWLWLWAEGQERRDGRDMKVEAGSDNVNCVLH